MTLGELEKSIGVVGLGQAAVKLLQDSRLLLGVGTADRDGVTTAGISSYYNICENWWGDCIVGGENALAEKVGMDAAELYEIIEAKLGPLRERLEADFHQSAEYQAKLVSLQVGTLKTFLAVLIGPCIRLAFIQTPLVLVCPDLQSFPIWVRLLSWAPCGSVWRPISTSPPSIRPNRNTSG